MLGFKPGAARSGSSFAAPHSCDKIINGLYQALIVQINWLQFEAFAPVLIFKLRQSFYRVRIMKNSLACTGFPACEGISSYCSSGYPLKPSSFASCNVNAVPPLPDLTWLQGMGPYLSFMTNSICTESKSYQLAVLWILFADQIVFN